MEKVSSFGSLSYFTKENKPKGAGTRCVECAVEPTCPYSAKKIYLENPEGEFSHIVVGGDFSCEKLEEAIKNGPYGRCVYGDCGNDVVDNQVVNFQFKSGATASFSMVDFTEEKCVRKTKVFCSFGEIDGDGRKIRIFDFTTNTATVIDPELEDKSLRVQTSLLGHDKGDYFFVKAFIDAIASNDPSLVMTNARETLFSHNVVFDAEESRLENNVKNIEW